MKDLTQGRPGRVILRFAIPILLGSIFQLFYSITDTYIIGWLLGDDALAAVGSVSPISDCIVGFLIGLTSGFAIVMARHFGAKDMSKLNQTFAGSLVLGLSVSVVLTALSVLFLPQILAFINTPQESMEGGMAYIRVILLGMTASMLYNVFASSLRAMGDTVAPLIFLVISAVLNAGLDYLLVGPLGFGIEGAATATVIAQFLSAFACFLYVRKRYEMMRLTRESFRFQKQMLANLMSSGVAMGLMNTLVVFGTMILQSSINTFEPDIIVGHYAARKLTNLFLMPGGVLGMTMASYCGQNYGAKRFDRVRQGIQASLLYSAIWCALALVVIYAWVPYMVSWMTNSPSQGVVDTATRYLRIDGILYIVAMLISIARNALQGIGYHSITIFSSALELVGKVLTVLYLAPALGYLGIILCEPIIWVIMVIPLLIRLYRSPVYEKKKKTYYYQDELKDEFSGIVRNTIRIDETYPYLRSNFGWEALSFIVYRIIMTPIAYLYLQSKFRMRVIGRKKLRQHRKESYYLIGNHTQAPGDGYIPTILTFPKRCSVIANADNLSLKGTKTFMELIGTYPLPTKPEGMKPFVRGLQMRADRGDCLVVFPEAHIWPYYTGIRPFTADSFAYAVKMKRPVYCFTTTYYKGKITKKPRVRVYVDGPFVPDTECTVKEAREKLRNQVYEAMLARSTYSEYAHIEYIKQDTISDVSASKEQMLNVSVNAKPSLM